MPEPQWYTKQGPDGKWYKTQASSPQEATDKLLRAIGQPQGKPDTAVDKMFPQGGTVSAPHPRTGLAGIEDQLATLRTKLSSSAQKGVGQGVGDFMESPLLGSLRVAKGVTELHEDKGWQGTKDVLGGAAEAGTIPGMVAAPEVEIPSATERAGKLFQELEKVAGKIPVDVEGPGRVATKIWDMAQAGGTRPKIINDFLRRVTNPEGMPMDYSEMRKFYQNATRLSADEANRLTPNIKRLIGEFTKTMGDSLWQAAQSVGQGGKYNSAMRTYRRAARVRDFKDTAVPLLAKGAATTAGAAAVYKLLEQFGVVPHAGRP